jgi:hypothetical protein
MQKWRESFKLTGRKRSVQKDRYDNGVRTVKFVTSKYLLRARYIE